MSDHQLLMDNQPVICLAMMVKDESAVLRKTLLSVYDLVDEYVIHDTGSIDGTQEIPLAALGVREGSVVRTGVDWEGYGPNRNRLLEDAKGRAQWTLMVDADMLVDHHQDLKEWLASDPDPSVDAWEVDVCDSGMTWKLPLLTRGGQDWEYLFPCHEYLDTSGRKTRPITGLSVSVRPFGNDGATPERFEEYIRLLASGVEEGEPRSVFYTAESLRFLGRTQDAIEMYQRRSVIDGGYEEERWFSLYQAAALSGSINSLVDAWRSRPWRHEPLLAAARIVAQNGPQEDKLFLSDWKG
jgi:glycosyltransferase involved in cell wall biosynthesis